MIIILLNELYSCISFIYLGKFISNVVIYKFIGEIICVCFVLVVCNGILRYKR